MVRLGMTPSSGQSDDNRTYPPSNSGPSFPTTSHLPFQYTQSRSARPHPQRPSTSVYGDNYCEESPSSSLPSSQLTSNVTPTGHTLLKTLSASHPTEHPHPSGWSQRQSRPNRESHVVAYQKVPIHQEDRGSHQVTVDDKYGREVRWCPMCRVPTVAGTVHHCTVSPQPHPQSYTPQQTVSSSPKVSISVSDDHVSIQPQAAVESYHSVPSTSSRTLSRVPSLLPIAQSPNQPVYAAPEGTRQGILVANPSYVKSRIVSPSTGHSSSSYVPGYSDLEREQVLPIDGTSGGVWGGMERDAARDKGVRLERGLVVGSDRGVAIGGHRGLIVDGERGGVVGGERGLVVEGERALMVGGGERSVLVGVERGRRGERSVLIGGERSVLVGVDMSMGDRNVRYERPAVIGGERDVARGGERRTEAEKRILLDIDCDERVAVRDSTGSVIEKGMVMGGPASMIGEKGMAIGGTAGRDGGMIGEKMMVMGGAVGRNSSVISERNLVMEGGVGRESGMVSEKGMVMGGIVGRDSSISEKSMVMEDERGVLVDSYSVERDAGVGDEEWDTANSLISRLTAGITSQQQDGSQRDCPSPSCSEESDTSSFFYQKESAQAVDPFMMAHQELMDETVKPDYPSHSHHPVSDQVGGQDSYGGGKRNRQYTGSESVSSELAGVDSSVSGSQDSDLEDSRGSTRHMPQPQYIHRDLATLLKMIRSPPLVPYTADKDNMNDFLELEDIGHINHLVKCISDAVLTISLPDTLYKDKGFTPLDYMDIHLNAVIRQFYFVFKSKDFLNLSLPDQIALLNGCSLGAVCCSGLYLFSQESGCWHIPGAASHVNQPVIHISDLLQVYPQQFVTKLFDLHTAAARLDFDWPMGVITNCVLMFTPLKKMVQEMDKIDVLRNKYVHLLLKYISWKHGHHNAALIFPEVLKILDAILLLVEELSTLNLNLSEDEVVSVEERLSTLTVIQMAPVKYQSETFREALASWSNLECVNLVDIHSRLCMALHMSMLDSFQSNTAEFWAATSMHFASNLSRESGLLSHHKKSIPQLMSTSEKLKDSSNNKNAAKRGREPSKISSVLGEKDLMLLRRFLEDVTTERESSMLVKNIKEKMNANQIQLIIKKLCS